MTETAPSTTAPGITRAKAATMGGHRVRVAPWQGQPYVALVGPARVNRGPSRAEIQRCIADLVERGVHEAVTPALSPFEAEPFYQAGFALHEELHLLARDLTIPPPKPQHRLRPGRPWHRQRVLEIDRDAFETFWQFDTYALREARRATPYHRFRVSMERGKVTGYAVTGRAGSRGYLQRLAVDPHNQSGGIGTSLVHDCLTWLYRRRAGTALVNTQHRNQRALALYERLGFIRQPDGLYVLRWSSPAT